MKGFTKLLKAVKEAPGDLDLVANQIDHTNLPVEQIDKIDALDEKERAQVISNK